MKNKKTSILRKSLYLMSTLCVVLFLSTSCVKAIDSSTDDSRRTAIRYISAPDGLLTYADEDKTIVNGLDWDKYDAEYNNKPIHIEIPAAVTEIENKTFHTTFHEGVPTRYLSINDDKTNLVKITFAEGSNFKSFEHSTFLGSTALKEIVLPKSLEHISSNAFEDCTALTKVYLPEGLINIDECAFQNNTSLTEISFPSSLKHIGNKAFAGASGLGKKGTSITINFAYPEGKLETSKNGIGGSIFLGTKITKDHIAFPETVKTWTDGQISKLLENSDTPLN